MNPIVPITVLCIAAGLWIVLRFLMKKRANGNEWNGWDRGRCLKRIGELHAVVTKGKADTKTGLEYARMFFATGDFSESQQLLQPLLGGAHPPAEAVYLAAHIDYLHGRYLQAERLFESLLRDSPMKVRFNAQLGLVGTAYQTNRYSKARNLFKGSEGKIQLALWEMMKNFGDEEPYRIDWKGNDRSILPFAATDPLPVIPVEINGRRIHALLDTGGEIFYLDESLADELGITPIAKQVEPYAGGKTVEVGYGRADSLLIGDVLLQSVPVKTGRIQRISALYEGKLLINGIVTTGILQQFLATIDYPHGRLVLQPRRHESGEGLKKEFEPSKTAEIPFVLGLTHIMAVKGAINGTDGLRFFLDSGLASSCALALPKESLDYLGIPVPPTEPVPDDKGGLAGGGFPVGTFPIKNCDIGPLRQENLLGVFGVFPPQLYRECEFIIDGLVSHQFLKKYQWTIDFDAMRMIFRT